MGFYKEVDLRSRKAMTKFLSWHFRYDTMNSWNCTTSYAHNLKVYNLPLSNEEKDRLYELIECEDAFYSINDLMTDFNVAHGYQYQAGFNGRSGGYLVLYVGGKEPSGYKSYCSVWYRRYYKTVEEIGTVCPNCEEDAIKNYTQTHMKVYSRPGQDIDQGEDYTSWRMEELRDRVKLIQEFDQLADDIVAEAKYLANNYEAEEETRMIPKTVRVLREKKVAHTA